MQFTEVKPEDVPQSRSRSQSASGDVIEGFLNAGVDLAEVTPGETDKSVNSLRANLQSYAQRKLSPVEVFTSGGRLFLRKDEAAPAKHQAATDRAATRKAERDAKIAAGEDVPKRTRKSKKADAEA